MNKNRQYQMKMVIGRLEPFNLVKLDFSLNFGLLADSKNTVLEAC